MQRVQVVPQILKVLRFKPAAPNATEIIYTHPEFATTLGKPLERQPRRLIIKTVTESLTYNALLCRNSRPKDIKLSVAYSGTNTHIHKAEC